jgi:hypothetical protein
LALRISTVPAIGLFDFKENEIFSDSTVVQPPHHPESQPQPLTASKLARERVAILFHFFKFIEFFSQYVIPPLLNIKPPLNT